jgi:dipeptidyl aminopeptidase/acylaminoacyl peptidase
MASNVNKVSSSIYCQACGAANPVQASRCSACELPLSTATTGTGARTNPLTGLLLPDVILYQRYRIREVLSTGDVSTVYKAEDIQLGNRLLALKEIGKNNQSTQEALEAIEESKREMLSLAALVHPNLPRIYDYFVENHRWYFVMDLLDGETLAAYLERTPSRSLPAEEVIDIGLQLATVLDYLHIRQWPLGFKDLALDTLWRTPDGKLYLLDTGTVPPAAIMPESLCVSSLGKVLRQLHTGKRSARSRLRIALPPRLRKQPRPPKQAQSAPLDVLLRTMTHRDATKRPINMGMVRQELQHLATQQMLATSRKRRVFSRRTFLILGGLIGLAGLGVVSSQMTDLVAFQLGRQIPHPEYGLNMGGTIYMHDAGDEVGAVAWSPDGTRLVVGKFWRNQVQSWDANTGQHVVNYSAPGLGGRVYAVAWLPNGQTLAAGGESGLWVWDATSGDIVTTYTEHKDTVIALANSPDSKYIASGSNDQTVQVWEVLTGRTVVVYRGHRGGIGAAAWSPDGRYIASASFDKTVQVWEAATGRTVFTYRGHTSGVYAVAWSPDGQHLASGGKDQMVQVWPVTLFENDGLQQSSTIISYHGHTAAVQTVSWSPDSRTIASAAENVQLWNGLTGRHIFTYTGNDISAVKYVDGLAWSPNGRYIASGGMEGTVQVWNATNQGKRQRV